MFGILDAADDGASGTTPKATQPIETGTVQWTRRLDDALAADATTVPRVRPLPGGARTAPAAERKRRRVVRSVRRRGDR